MLAFTASRIILHSISVASLTEYLFVPEMHCILRHDVVFLLPRIFNFHIRFILNLDFSIIFMHVLKTLM